MLKAHINQYLHLRSGVEHSPRQGFQGFTLAEVLITLGIIGVVAAMTIPTLVANYQERSFNTAATVFERKLGESLKVMNSQSSLAGFDSTEDFVDELSKHFKINKVCQNGKLMDCFEEEVFWGGGEATPESVEMNTIKTSKHFGQDTWQQTNIVGVQFASGVTALIAYNKDATQDPYSNQIITFSGSSNGRSGSVKLGTDSLAILYDTNGAKSPNQSSKDIRSINVSKLGSNCFAKVDGLCITLQPSTPIPLTIEECESLQSSLGINACYHENDSWAGAVKACGGVSNLPSSADLVKIANYVYNTDSVSSTDSTSGLHYDDDKATELGLPSPFFYIWSREEDETGLAHRRLFDASTTYADSYMRYPSDHLVICLDNE